MVPMFLAAVDQTMLATATPVISRELGSLRDTSWLAVALPAGLGDHGAALWPARRPLRPRNVLSFAIVVFALGSLACGVAPTLGDADRRARRSRDSAAAA